MSNRWIIGFESSGVTRNAMRERGVDAWSCNLLPADDGGEHHFQGDIFDILQQEPFDFGLFHPECTFLTGSAEWCYKDDARVKPGTLFGAERRQAREQALAEFARLVALCCYRLKGFAIENPVGVLSRRFRKPDQIIQPYEFGEDASKKTCLWLWGLPKLRPTQRIPGRMVNGRERWANQTDGGYNRLPPGPDRWKLRSRTYPGIARAMADQWALADTMSRRI